MFHLVDTLVIHQKSIATINQRNLIGYDNLRIRQWHSTA